MKSLPSILTVVAATLSACVSAGSGPPPQRAPDPAAMLANADMNGDGVITKIEFVDSRGVLFDRLDRSKDGYLDRDDAPRRRRGGGGGGGRLAELQQSLDANRDGRVSRLEFTDGPAILFDRGDLNGDDRLDASELAALKSQAAARRAGA